MGRGKSYDSYEEVVDRIYELEKFRGRISLEPIESVMEQLEDPHQAVPTIHVAGTNGKGSTTILLAAMLEAAGYTVGTYTSPHLMDFRERVRVNGRMITPTAVEAYYEKIMETGVELSFFEFTTALAFLHFAREQVDVAILETGLGGRLDATNIVTPELSIITNVARDHTKWLGETAEQIAYEKAGIIKEDVPVVSGADGTSQEVITAVAAEHDAPVHDVEELVAPELTEHGLAFRIGPHTVETGILGNYQCNNINAALTACRLLDGFTVPLDAVRDGLHMFELPGRMECIADHPRVLLDGAHNPAGMRAAADTIRHVQRGKTITVVSIMADKEYESMMQEVEAFSDLIIVSRADQDRAADPEQLAASIEHTDHEVVPDIRRAIETVLPLAADDDTVVFTGSLYFIGDVKQTLDAMWY